MKKRYFLLALLLSTTFVISAQKDKKGSDVGFLPTDGDALAGSVITAFDSTLWDKINLTSPRMKKSNKPFPWWIPITAGGAAIVTGVILLTDNEKDTTIIPDKPIAINDNFSVPCGQNTYINPLVNDFGDEIRISEVVGAPQGTVTFNDNSILIIGNLNQDLIISYTIIDRYNQTASAVITISLIFPQINLVNREEIIRSGELVSGNIFDGGNCQECVVFLVSSEPATTIDWNANGTYSFTGPEVQELTTILFTFQVRDRCDQVTSGTLTVIINPPCSIEPTFSIIPEDCDLENGEIQTAIDNIEIYDFEWSEGSTNSNLQQVSAGTYNLRITLRSDPACFQEFEFEVPSTDIPTVLNDDEYEAVSYISITGNVLDNDQGSGLRVIDFTAISVSQFEILEDGSFVFLGGPGAEGFYEAEYTIIDTCGRIFTAVVRFNVTSPPCNFVTDITTTPADCGKENGAASVIINPPGNQYVINWPNGQTGPSATGFPQGAYSVSVHDPDLGCTLMFPFSIGENPPDTYLESISSSPGTCIGDGEITITLFNPSGKEMNLNLEYDGEPIADIQLQNGTHQLSDYFNIASGTYSILIVEMDCPPRCGQTVQITVAEQNLPMTINDDEYTIEWNGFWEGNVLTNDQGTGLVVVSFTQPSSGNTNINSDGTGFFVPEPDFSGTVTFAYTVQDTCGQTQTANITIIVEEPPCDYDVTFSTTPASCGLSDGSAVISHFPNDPVTFLWSNGQTGPVLSDVSSDFYNVTLTNPVTNCVLVFVIFVDENDPDHIISVDIIPSSCNSPGDAIMELQGSGQFTVLVSGPGGSSQFTAGNGIVSVGENVDLSAGSWTVIVIDDIAGPDCALAFTFDLENYIPIAIELLDVIPPSSPSAEDGEIIIQIAGGNPPYIIFANSNSYGPVGPGVVVLDGLGTGLYEVFAFDDTECPSEVLNVELEGFQGNPISSFKAINVSSVISVPQHVISHLQNTPEWQINSNQFEKPFNLDELRLYSKLNFGATLLFALRTNNILGIDVQRNQGSFYPTGNHSYDRWSVSQIHLLAGRHWTLNKYGFQLLTGPGALDINGTIGSNIGNGIFNQTIASWRIQPTIQYRLWKQLSISAGTNIDLPFPSFKFQANVQISVAFNFK